MIWFLAAVTVIAAGLAGHAQYSATRKDRTIGDLVAMIRTEQTAQHKDHVGLSRRVDDLTNEFHDYRSGLSTTLVVGGKVTSEADMRRAVRDALTKPAPTKKAAPARTLAPSKKAAPRPKGPAK